MPITEAEREQRKGFLGSSDMAAVLGLKPFGRTEQDVYLDKTDQLDPLEPTTVMQAGTYLEYAINAYAEAELGPLEQNVRRVHKDNILAANIDAVVIATQEAVEAKASFAWDDPYGAPGTSEVPEHVIVQAHVHMICLPADVCHVPVFRERAFSMYHVPRHPDIVDAILTASHDFWYNHVVPAIPPDEGLSLDTLKRLIRQPGKVVKIEDPAPIVRWQQFNTALLKLEKKTKAARDDVIEMLGNAEGATCDLGLLTYLPQRGAAKVDRAGLLRDGLGKYLSPNEYPVLRLKKPK